MTGNADLNGDFLALLWKSIQNGGTEFWIFMTIFILLIFRNDIPDMVKGLWSGICWFFENIVLLRIINKKPYNYKNVYNKDTLLNHQIFKDLQYWLTVGVNNIKISDNEAKEAIAKSIFTIYARSSQSILREFINNNNIEDLSNDELKSSFKRELEIHSANVIALAREDGIPELFLQKYFMVSEGFHSLKNAAIDSILSNDFAVDNFVKMNMIYTIIGGTLSNVFHNLASTVKSINGDLNGLVYKHYVIGYKKGAIISVPTGVDTDVVFAKLKDFMYALNGSRAYIYKFLPYDEFYSGYHSCVYEVVNAGISRERQKLQKMHNNFLKVPDETDKNPIIRLRADMDEVLNERLSQRGIYALSHILLFNGKEKADGMLVINWNSKDAYEQAVKDGKIEETIKFYGALLESYIVYKDGELS